jgi:ABC-type branched-subunit amino acid transport system substrate-binding protein
MACRYIFLNASRWSAIAAVLSLLGCVSPQDETIDKDAIAIGALLPFTGDLAASGTNLERSLILAADEINAVGGVGKRPIRIVSEDTHSDLDRGFESAKKLIDEEKVSVLVGPEDMDLARKVSDLLPTKQVVMISGGAASPSYDDVAAGYWYRIVPSVQKMSEALSARMIQDSVANAAILSVEDEIGNAFSKAVSEEYEAVGGVPVGPFYFDSGASSYIDLIQSTLDYGVDGIVLIAYPKSGATIVREWSLLSNREKWYFAPSLRAEEFVQNVTPGALDGMIGVSAGLPADASLFSDMFAERWLGEKPLPNAYFYFDAAVVAALAIATGSAAVDGAMPTGSAIGQMVSEVASPMGMIVTWEELSEAFGFAQRGEDINYRGVSGAVDFNANGDVSMGLVQFWTIKDNVIKTLQ